MKIVDDEIELVIDERVRVVDSRSTAMGLGLCGRAGPRGRTRMYSFHRMS